MHTQQQLKNLFSGIAIADVKKMVVAHGTYKPTPSGPVYVGCHCDKCTYARTLFAK